MRRTPTIQYITPLIDRTMLWLGYKRVHDNQGKQGTFVTSGEHAQNLFSFPLQACLAHEAKLNWPGCHHAALQDKMKSQQLHFLVTQGCGRASHAIFASAPAYRQMQCTTTKIPHSGLGGWRVLCTGATPKRQLTAAPSTMLLSSLEMTQVLASGGAHRYLRVACHPQWVTRKEKHHGRL